MKKFLVYAVLICTIFTLVVFAGCTSPEGTNGETGDEVNGEVEGEVSGEVEGDPEKIIMGTNADFPPFEFRNDENEVDGFDVDIAKAIADALGRELVIEDMEFGGLTQALHSKRIDMAIAGMTITEERLEEVDFSEPYYNAGQTVVVLEDETEIKSVDDLEGKDIAVQLGTTGDLEAHERFPAEKIRQYNKINEGFLDLINKRVDAIIIDVPVAERYIEIKGGCKTVGGVFTEELFGVAVSKENPELLDEINKVLADLKESGQFDELISKWFE
ncbi:MAG: basic amino acid ABC transporter substrate-binding protein [Firmicutes bacterium]|nr:basic amino acid ABC transporter substrate-binding protein [Bacillota bacterium]